MTFKAQNVRGLHQIRIVVSAVHVMTAKAAYAVGVHLAGNKIIALHPVLVGSTIRKVCKGLFPKLMLFQLPEILKVFANFKPNRPIVVLAFNGVL